MASHKIGSYSPAQLQQFVAKHFTTGRAALVGVGIPHADITKVLYAIAVFYSILLALLLTGTKCSGLACQAILDSVL
jgi:hypothetical protein